MEESITSLLVRYRGGDKAAVDELFERVYPELRKIARRTIINYTGKKPLNVTALVNSACERLLEREQLDAENRTHFFYLLSRAMHDTLVEESRAARAAKRGGQHKHVSIAGIEIPDGSKSMEFVELHGAIEDLRLVDHESAEVVVLRYFGGRTLEEAADALGCSSSVVQRHWVYARAWLRERLST